MAKQRLTISISSENKEFLKLYALMQDKSMSACVNDLITSFRKEEKTKAAKKKIQTELLTLLSGDVSYDDIRAIKKLIANYLLEKAREKADVIWDERGYTDEKLKTMLFKN